MLPSNPYVLSEAEEINMQRFSTILRYPFVHSFDIQSANCPATLTNWRLITPLLAALSEYEREAFRTSSALVGAGGYRCVVPPR